MKNPDGVEFSGYLPGAAEEVLNGMENVNGANLLFHLEMVMSQEWKLVEPADILETLAFIMGRCINGGTFPAERAKTMAETFKRVKYWSDRIGENQR